MRWGIGKNLDFWAASNGNPGRLRGHMVELVVNSEEVDADGGGTCETANLTLDDAKLLRDLLSDAIRLHEEFLKTQEEKK